MKKCYCESCKSCPPLPKDCKFNTQHSIFGLIEYAKRTKDELEASLKWGNDAEK